MNLLEAMYSRPDGSDGRESRTWWAINDGRVVETIGWSCAPNNPDYWWCPSLGYSMCEGVSLFPTEEQAKAALRNDLLRKLAALG